MSPAITPIDVPPSSVIYRELHDADFHDCYAMAIAHADRSALELYLNAVARTPLWVGALMAIRNRLASFLGLKNLGHLGALDQRKEPSAYRVGDRVGVFSLLFISNQEIVLGDSDKHLDVKISICKLTRNGRESIAATTVVHIHNLLGRIYMRLVVPIHKRIVPAVLGQAALGRADA
ncbi:MAG: DUF2867 domain-containing protein [Rhodospirillales bacterium]|jgi:hypothetical protein